MDKPFSHIVVPLDGSDRARTALRPAVELARRTNVPITLFANVVTASDGVDAEAELQAVADAHLGDAVIDMQVVQSDDGAAREIVSHADGADALVCMASHGHGTIGHLILGSVTEEVLRLSRRPVLVVGPNVDPDRSTTAGSVLACLDGSTFSEAVLPVATTWATSFDLRLWLVTVIDIAAVEKLHAMVPGDDVHESGYLSNTAHKLPVRADWEVLHSRTPAREIVSFADRLPAAIVAVATHGRTGWRRIAAGSVAMGIVHESRCPVLIVSSTPEGSTPDEG